MIEDDFVNITNPSFIKCEVGNCPCKIGKASLKYCAAHEFWYQKSLAYPCSCNMAADPDDKNDIFCYTHKFRQVEMQSIKTIPKIDPEAIFSARLTSGVVAVYEDEKNNKTKLKEEPISTEQANFDLQVAKVKENFDLKVAAVLKIEQKEMDDIDKVIERLELNDLRGEKIALFILKVIRTVIIGLVLLGLVISLILIINRFSFYVESGTLQDIEYQRSNSVQSYLNSNNTIESIDKCVNSFPIHDLYYKKFNQMDDLKRQYLSGPIHFLLYFLDKGFLERIIAHNIISLYSYQAISQHNINSYSAKLGCEAQYSYVLFNTKNEHYRFYYTKESYGNLWYCINDVEHDLEDERLIDQFKFEFINLKGESAKMIMEYGVYKTVESNFSKDILDQIVVYQHRTEIINGIKYTKLFMPIYDHLNKAVIIQGYIKPTTENNLVVSRKSPWLYRIFSFLQLITNENSCNKPDFLTTWGWPIVFLVAWVFITHVIYDSDLNNIIILLFYYGYSMFMFLWAIMLLIATL